MISLKTWICSIRAKFFARRVVRGPHASPAVELLRCRRYVQSRRASAIVAGLLLGWMAAAAGLRGTEHAPLLQPDFPPYAPYPGMPLNAGELTAWNSTDHLAADAALYTVYSGNILLTPVSHREDTYTRLRGRVHIFSDPGDTGFHFSVSGEADRIQFLKHDQLSDNEFAGALFAHSHTDSLDFRLNYTGGQRLVPDEDHFSLLYNSYVDKRVVQDGTGSLAFGTPRIGIQGQSNVRAISFPGLLNGRNNVIATTNVVRLGLRLSGLSDAAALTQEVFPDDFRYAQVKGRFDARPVERYAPEFDEVYALCYFGTVHLLHPDNLGAAEIDPAFTITPGVGLQSCFGDFGAVRLEVGAMRFEMLGSNGLDHPGWQTAYWNLRAEIAPWDALLVYLDSHSQLCEMRDAAYAQEATGSAGAEYFINRTCELDLDYTYTSLIASRSDLGRYGDCTRMQFRYRFDRHAAFDFRVEARRRKVNLPSPTAESFNDTRATFGLVLTTD
ncbi:MAG: hypothetical protein ACREJ2_02455 [Planctomycetota bacterium]